MRKLPAVSALIATALCCWILEYPRHPTARPDARLASTGSRQPDSAPDSAGSISEPPVTSQLGPARGPTPGEAEDSQWYSQLAAIAEFSDSGERSRELRQLADALPADRIRLVLEALLRESPNTSGAELRRLLIERWVRIDPQAAAEWARRLADNQTNREVFEQVTIAWANADLASAVDW